MNVLEAEINKWNKGRITLYPVMVYFLANTVACNQTACVLLALVIMLLLHLGNQACSFPHSSPLM